MKKNVKISFAVMSLLLFSCNNNSSEKSLEKTETITKVEQHHEEMNVAIALNKGEKWKIDPKMLTFIRKMENHINSFSKTELKDYKSLAELLQTNIDLLTSNCTMKGKAHDELHKWLLPFIELVDEFSDVKNSNEATTLHLELKESFVTFNQFFI